MKRLYFDHNASSPARPEVIDAMVAALNTPGNASAPHGTGRAAHKLVSDGREAVGLAMGVCAQDVIFTGSGTESINTAIKSAGEGGSRRMLVSGMDHPASVLAAEASGAQVDLIPTLQTGQIDMDWLAQTLKSWNPDDGAPFITISAANSETGVIQEVETATDLVHDAGGYILVDAVQTLGKVHMQYLVDYLAVSAHKVGGPQGVGALYVAPNAPYTSLLTGGGQEKRRRAGTLNVAGIAGFGAAVEAATSLDFTASIRDTIEAGLRKMEPNLTIFSADTKRLPNTCLFSIPDTSSSTLMMGLDLEGISVSTGLACSSGKVGASRAITAMGLADKAPKGAIRISLGYTSIPEDAERFLTAWAKIRRHALKGAA